MPSPVWRKLVHVVPGGLGLLDSHLLVCRAICFVVLQGSPQRRINFELPLFYLFG